MKVVAGDWPEGWSVDFVHTNLKFHTTDDIEIVPFEDIQVFEVVTEENRASVAGKLGWSAVGLIAAGPFGLLAGAILGGNRRERLMAVRFKDHRRALIKGTSKDAETLAAATF